jgi:hypothetical protein
MAEPCLRQNVTSQLIGVILVADHRRFFQMLTRNAFF